MAPPTPNFVKTVVYKEKKKNQNILPVRINIHVAICSQCLILKNQQKDCLRKVIFQVHQCE